MSNTHRHKIIGKFMNGLIEMKDIHLSVKRFWNRHNGSLGHYRHKRIVKRIKDLDHGSNN